jgi:hypothetical protein
MMSTCRERNVTTKTRRMLGEHCMLATKRTQEKHYSSKHALRWTLGIEFVANAGIVYPRE